MRGDAPPPVMAPSSELARNKRKSDPRPSGTPTERAQREGEAVPVVDMLTAGGELQKRSRPAVATDLSAMRELANIQARHAIDTHGQKRSLHRAYGTLGTSAACFLAVFVVLTFSSDFLLRACAMVVLVVGIYFLVTSLLSAKNVFATMRKKSSGLRAILDEVEAELAANEDEEQASPAASTQAEPAAPQREQT
jgi:hypothetical protein